MQSRHNVYLACAITAMLFIAVGAAHADDAVDEKADAANRAAAKEAAALVSKLGDASFQVRRDATRKLLSIGMPALDALVRASKDEDPEVRYRAGRLYREVRVQVNLRRLERFLADPKSVPVESVPGLEQYVAIVGDGADARKLFVDMHRAESKLFLMLDDNIKTFEDEYEVRAMEVRYLLSTPAARKRIPVTAAALMFLSLQPKVTISDRASGAVIGLANYNEFRTALTAKTSAIRRLVGHWVATHTSGPAIQRLMLALRHNLEEGITPALATLKTPANPYELQYALLTVARFGSKDHLAEVEKLFTNKAAVTRVGGGGKKVKFSSEVRDIALAVAIHLTGQNPKTSYGFPRLATNSQYVFNPNTAGFNDDTTRAAAFKKWSEWRAKMKQGKSGAPQKSTDIKK